MTKTGRIGSRQVTDLVDPAGVAREFADGATIVLQGLHRYWAPVTALCRQLEAELTHPVQANAYLTPPGSQGLQVHADGHDVFALQCAGRKEWVLHEDGANAPATWAPTLVPGDALYVPKGTAHAARTVAEASLHLTIGVRRFTWAQALRPAVDEVLGSAELDQPLPVGFARDPGALTVELVQRLRDVATALEKRESHPLADAVARRFWSTRLPPLEGQLLQVLALDAIDDDTTLVRRPHAHAQLEASAGAVIVQLADRRLRLPGAAEPVLRRILACDTLRVGELADVVDAPSRLVLARRLVAEGLLRVEGVPGADA